MYTQKSKECVCIKTEPKRVLLNFLPHRISLPQVISPSLCLGIALDLVPPLWVLEVAGPPLWVLGVFILPIIRGEDSACNEEVSDAVRRGRRRGVTPSFGANSPFRPARFKAGFKAGASDGAISRANSLTSTAPSCWLSFSTISYIPYFSTNAERLGWTSQIAFRSRKRFNRTTALLWLSRSIIRWKNWDFAIPSVIGLDKRQIFRKGSSKFSNEFAFAWTKHLTRESKEVSLQRTSSTRAVSSCNLQAYLSFSKLSRASMRCNNYQYRIASNAPTWKYGSASSFKYSARPSCCHNKVRQLFVALAKSHRIGKANCLSGEPDSVTFFKLGIIPAWAASSCLALFNRHIL